MSGSQIAEDGLPPLREIIARHGLNAKRSLGQNFLLDLNLTGRIARQAGPVEGGRFLEIGPGPGGLTRALLAQETAKVTVIEQDERCLPALEEIAAHYPGRLRIIHGDALKLDHAALVDGPVRIAANLPYNIATPLLTGWLGGAWPPFWQSMTLMFQREVAERIVARPGDKAYGRLSVLAGLRSKAEIAFDIGPKAFTPPPKVTSSVVRFEPIAEPLPCDLGTLERVTAAAFGQRRKMLRGSLKAIGGNQLLDRAAIDGERRAETLSVEEFVALANAL